MHVPRALRSLPFFVVVVSVIIRDIAGGYTAFFICCIIFSSFLHVAICTVFYAAIILFLSR